jgi:hypothetical protein
MTSRACCAQALTPELASPITHDAMLAVGNSELNYNDQFYMSCLEKIICKIK